jgi:hypothetical protein
MQRASSLSASDPLLGAAIYAVAARYAEVVSSRLTARQRGDVC